MKLIPKRKLFPVTSPESLADVINYVTNAGATYEYLAEFTTNIGALINSLDDILDGIAYGKVLQTNLSSNALKIITAQIALLNLIAAADDTSDLGSSSILWRYLYVHDISLNTDIIPVTTNASDLGSSSKEFALGYIKNTYIDTRLQIPVGTDMYD